MSQKWGTMNKIENYLSGLDTKNLVLLYLSLFFLIGLIYYNYNYSVLGEKIKANSEQIEKLKHAKNEKQLHRDLVNLRKNLKKTQLENQTLKEDLKYLNILIKTSPVLNISENEFLDILQTILKKATYYNVKASYTIKKSQDKFVKYDIVLEGKMAPEEFLNFLEFIRSIEKMHIIKQIRFLNLQAVENEKELGVDFKMELILWGLI